jgi:glutathione reductase (NADPH)
MDPDQKAKTFVKVVCTGLDDRVKGIHVLGMKADEMM